MFLLNKLKAFRIATTFITAALWQKASHFSSLFYIAEAKPETITLEMFCDPSFFNALKTLSTDALENGKEAKIDTNLLRIGYFCSPVAIFAALIICLYSFQLMSGFALGSNTCRRHSRSNTLVSSQSFR